MFKHLIPLFFPVRKYADKGTSIPHPRSVHQSRNINFLPPFHTIRNHRPTPSLLRNSVDVKEIVQQALIGAKLVDSLRKASPNNKK